jgi:two-component system response regulator ChvI
MKKIAIVAHDPEICDKLAQWSEALEYKVTTYRNSAHATKVFRQQAPDIIVSEIMNGQVDGALMTQAIREHHQIPVIHVGAALDEISFVMSARSGADRLLPWPTTSIVFSATVKATVERYQELSVKATRGRNDITVGSLLMDVNRHEVIWKGESVRLTNTEFDMLYRLAQRPGNVKSREQLVSEDALLYRSDRIVDSHIKRIRRKMCRIDPTFDQIETLYGIGYRYVPDSANGYGHRREPARQVPMLHLA